MLSLAGHFVTKSSTNITGIFQKAFHIAPCARCQSAAALHMRSPASSRHAAVQHFYQQRWFSDQPQRKGFFGGMKEDIDRLFKKDEELQKNIQKFRESSKKIEESDAIKKARAKFEAIEKEGKQTEQIKQKFGEIKDTVGKKTEELGKSEYVQSAKKAAESIGETAGKTAEAIYKQTEGISQTKAFQTASKGVKAAKSEFEDITYAKAHIYHSPTVLTKRTDLIRIKGEEKIIEADTESTGIVMHKDSVWQANWQNFKDNNKFVNKMFEMKVKYDESDNVVVRLTRTVTDKVTGLFGNVFTPSEMSEVVTEISKIDPTFSQQQFINQCRHIFIPNILESAANGDLAVLESWCYEAEFNKLAMPTKMAKEKGCRLFTDIIDVSQIDIMGGAMNDFGPMLIISFQTQEVAVVKDMKGNIIEGDPEKVLKVTNVWAFARDQEVLEPNAAWRLVESHKSAQTLFV